MSNSRAIALLAFWGASLVSAQVTSPPPQFPGQMQGDFIIKAFRFNSGEVMRELRLHYVTLGTPHRDSSGEIDNAVLLLHSTGSDTTEFVEPPFRGPLYGSGQPLDVTKFYLIIPDAIGHGKSSKPSDGLRGHFPHYGYNDMVVAQYRLVTEKLGIKRMRQRKHTVDRLHPATSGTSRILLRIIRPCNSLHPPNGRTHWWS